MHVVLITGPRIGKSDFSFLSGLGFLITNTFEFQNQMGIVVHCLQFIFQEEKKESCTFEDREGPLSSDEFICFHTPDEI